MCLNVKVVKTKEESRTSPNIESSSSSSENKKVYNNFFLRWSYDVHFSSACISVRNQDLHLARICIDTLLEITLTEKELSVICVCKKVSVSFPMS